MGKTGDSQILLTAFPEHARVHKTLIFKPLEHNNGDHFHVECSSEHTAL
jgi:hypothetical protein